MMLPSHGGIAGRRLRDVCNLRGVADALGLAAAPTFLVMAALTAGPPNGPQAALCLSGPGASAAGGMPAMYLLMAAFHLVPWLRLTGRF